MSWVNRVQYFVHSYDIWIVLAWRGGDGCATSQCRQRDLADWGKGGCDSLDGDLGAELA